MISYFRSLSHVKRALLKSVIVIDVKCYNIIQPQHVKCKQNDEWAKYCAFGLENMERRKPKNRGKSRKLARRRLYRYLRRRCLVSSVFLLLLTQQLFRCAPSLPRVWSKSRYQSFWEETCQGWSDDGWVENLEIGAYQSVNSCLAAAVVSVFIACSSKICRDF